MKDDKKDQNPVFDLILGCPTMSELGIVLDFVSKTITIDDIILRMRDINKLYGTKTLRALASNNSLAPEPTSTDIATQRIVKILDAKYRKKQTSRALSKTLALT